MKSVQKICAEEFFSRIDRDHSLMAKKMRIRTVLRRHGSFSQRVVNERNWLFGKVVATEEVDRFKLELDRYLDVLQV